MLVDYARVRVRDRDLEVQRGALRKAGCETIIEVRQEGKTAHRVRHLVSPAKATASREESQPWYGYSTMFQYACALEFT